MAVLVAGVALVLWGRPAAAQSRPPVEVLTERGCLACHRTDGSPGPAPSFAGLIGRETTVTTPSGVRTFRIDAEYLRRSIREPAAEVVSGYPADGMPALPLDDAAVDEVVDALERLEPEQPASKSIVPLAIGALGFLLLHLGMSFHPVRRRAIERWGERWFQGIYALVVASALVLIIVGWIVRPFIPIWTPPAWTRSIPLAVMPLAFVALIAGFLTKNPATAGQVSALSKRPEGVVAITRHPALWGFASWGASHLCSNGDLASMLLFGSIGLLAVLGMMHIDSRRARAFGSEWRAFTDQTSIVPFVAILRGRARFGGAGLGYKAMLGLIAYLLMLFLHEWAFGVSPWPF